MNITKETDIEVWAEETLKINGIWIENAIDLILEAMSYFRPSVWQEDSRNKEQYEELIKIAGVVFRELKSFEGPVWLGARVGEDTVDLPEVRQEMVNFFIDSMYQMPQD